LNIGESPDDETRKNGMRNCLTKTFNLIMLCTTTAAIPGCFEGSGTDSANNAPTISGNPPPSVKVGDNYAFTPGAMDPDGDTLSFSIQNRPMWANFDTTTGSLSGVADPGSEGTYANIRITVSDGSLSATLPEFSVTVTQVALGSATLSWTPPTQNEDGTTLTDLAGYKIYYGDEPGNYQTTIQIDNPGVVTYVVENLTPDTYYFVATAFNAQGVESGFSGEATKVVN
jgi:hypothetical protein